MNIEELNRKINILWKIANICTRCNENQLQTVFRCEASVIIDEKLSHFCPKCDCKQEEKPFIFICDSLFDD